MRGGMPASRKARLPDVFDTASVPIARCGREERPLPGRSGP